MTDRTFELGSGELAKAYRGRAQRFPEAIKAGLRRIMVLVQRGADQKLSGGGAAWEYPVPRRSGALARGLYGTLGDDYAEIGNIAPHAWSIHSGNNPAWHSPPAIARPFLDDAAASVDHLAEMQSALAGAW